MNLPRLYHTLKHLKPIQIKYQIRHRLFPVRKELKFLSESTEAPPIKKLDFTPWIEKQVSFTKDCTFEFLNNKKTFENDQINWQEESFGKLWTYNLNYMDYLLQPRMSKKNGLQLIKDFIRKLPSNAVGIEPYPISLRGINWIKFLSKHNINDEEINRSLWFQYKLLSKRPEYHLLGNHLLENGFSLLFAAFYFGEKSIYNQAKTILFEELNEQILQDGGHFELSPMYHQIILDRLLDGINLLKNNKIFKDQALLFDFFVEKAISMLSWLKNMTFSNGDIPLFNDATFGIAPTSHELFEYAHKLLGTILKEKTLKLSDSGYRRFNGLNYECIVDAGPLGPDYIPGHAHADMLSFVLYVDQKPFIVDYGISTYEKNKTRHNERSTKSHNTVVVNDKNQSDVWGGFRVAKRAKLKIVSENNSQITALHDGYNPVIHQRQFSFEANQIIIEDKLSKYSKARAYFYFSPDINIFYNGKEFHNEKAQIKFENESNVKLENILIPEGYNKFRKSKRIVVTFENHFKTTFKFL